MNACLRWLLLIALATSPLVLRAENTAAILTRLKAAETENSLDVSGIKPWHLKVNFQLSDDPKQPPEQGTLEEWWSGPDLYKISFIGPSYTATEIQNQNGLFRTHDVGSSPYLLDILHTLLMHPMPAETVLESSTPWRDSLAVAKIKLDCFKLQPTAKGHTESPLAPLPTYCFDTGLNILRLFSFDGYLEVVRNQIGTFQNRSVSTELLVSEDGSRVIGAKITTLATFAPNATDFTPASDMPKVPEAVRKPSGDVAVRKVSGPQPIYPQSAKDRHISGAVIMKVLIGTDGRIHRLEVVSSPDDALSASAQRAVQHWVYKPFLLNGAPIEVITTVTIKYNFG